MRYRNPALATDKLQPLFIGSARGEVVIVSLYLEVGVLEDRGELLAEITVGEENKTQAARS